MAALYRLVREACNHPVHKTRHLQTETRRLCKQESCCLGVDCVVLAVNTVVFIQNVKALIFLSALDKKGVVPDSPNAEANSGRNLIVCCDGTNNIAVTVINTLLLVFVFNGEFNGRNISTHQTKPKLL